MTRFRDDGRRIEHFADHVLVVCPRCGGCADVMPASAGTSGPRRLTCPSCGLVREQQRTTATFGAAVDPYFGLPLFLQAPCAGGVVWAYNRAQLEHLLAFVTADVRERRTPADPNDAAPTSMVEKLPAWITSAKNRHEVVRALTSIRRLLS